LRCFFISEWQALLVPTQADWEFLGCFFLVRF